MNLVQHAGWLVWLALAVAAGMPWLSPSACAQSPAAEGDGDAAQSSVVRKAFLTVTSRQDEDAQGPDDSGQTNRAAATPCVSQDEMGQNLTPITRISLDIGHKSDLLPPDCYAEHHAASLAGIPVAAGRRTEFAYDFHWAPSGLVHNPLYFEDVPLERYGQGYSPLFQPAVSAAKFGGNVMILPYRIGLDPPYTLDYTLGYYRPGSWAPAVRPHLPWSWSGAALQAGAMTGFLFMFP